MYVIDTDVISRTSPLSRDGGGVGSWLQANGDESFLCALTLTEVHFGALRLQIGGATRQARALTNWIESVTAAYERRILPIDSTVARRSGELMAVAEKAGYQAGVVDACVAAAADIHGFTVVTFNARHCDAFGVPHERPALNLGP